MVRTVSVLKNRLVADGLATVAASDRMAAIAALLVGAFLIWGVGFAHADLLHSVAHDGRHAFAFPCH